MSFLDQERNRKDSHIHICLTEEVDFYSPDNSFSRLNFEHDALPELDLADVDIKCEILGKTLQAPLYIGSMTGGTPSAEVLNKRLSQAAARCGVGMALGSQRRLLQEPAILSSYAVKKGAPDLPLLFGNIGAVQLNYGVTANDLRKLIEATQCDGFFFHLNPLQEAIQPEGQSDFKGLLKKLEVTIKELPVPVLVKEVGAGISKVTADKLRSLPIAGIETAGVGGTSWAKIEGLRRAGDNNESLGEIYSQWGVSTLDSLINIRESCPDLLAFASGGIRNGLEAAKALALGASAIGMALPFLKAAEKSTEAVAAAIEKFKMELKLALFLTGSKNLLELRTKKLK